MIILQIITIDDLYCKNDDIIKHDSALCEDCKHKIIVTPRLFTNNIKKNYLIKFSMCIISCISSITKSLNDAFILRLYI